MLRIIEELIGISVLHKLTQIHDRGAVRNVANNRKVVRHEQIAHAQLGFQLIEEVEHTCLDRHIQSRHWLVENNQLGLGSECTCQGDALALAPGKVTWKAVNMGRVQPHQFHELVNPSILVPLPVQRIEGLANNVCNCHARIQGPHGVLEHDLNIASQKAAL